MAMIFIDGMALARCRDAVACAVVFIAMWVLQGCAGGVQTASMQEAQLAPTRIPADFFIPKGYLAQRNKDEAQQSASAGLVEARSPVSGSVLPLVPEVLLYASETTSTFLSSGGLDARVNTRVWEIFLRKYKIPFRVISSVELLEKTQPGVLLLPSSVALSDAEKRAVAGFRNKGGSVLTTWLTGVRDERAAWKGFGFMEEVLNVKVAGNTQADEDDNFMVVHGDNPIAHSLPAGLRVWLERVDELYPLRLQGGHAAANIMDWSRTYVPGQHTTAIVFDERRQTSGFLSRSVVLGYPERMWLSADPKSMEALAHNALVWLLRQPAVYLSAWPHPYNSAFVLAVDVASALVENDLVFSKMLEDAGGRASYYLLGDLAAKSAGRLKKLQSSGHELGYLGDRFDGFRFQPTNTQIKRLDAMRKAIADAGIVLPADAGFRPPLESYDQTTERLVREGAFGHFVALMDATETRLPFMMSRGENGDQSGPQTVVLPRTQASPDQWMEENDPDEGLQFFLEELTLTAQMSGLSFVRVPNQSLMSSDQLDIFFSSLKERSDRMWLATASQVTRWWRERETIHARLEAGLSGPVLVVTQTGAQSGTLPATVWVNLPGPGSVLRIVDTGGGKKLPKVGSVDAWRASVSLEGLAPGEHRWSIHFE